MCKKVPFANLIFVSLCLLLVSFTASADMSAAYDERAYDYLTELVRSSSFPFRDVKREDVNLLIDHDRGDRIFAKLFFETDGTGTVGWISYFPQRKELFNCSADLNGDSVKLTFAAPWADSVISYRGTQETGKYSFKRITDIKNWSHPIKKVFISNGWKVDSLYLYNNSVYPWFYLQKQSAKPIDSPSAVKALAQANGWWDFGMTANTDRISVMLNRANKSIRLISSNNGWRLFLPDSGEIQIGIDYTVISNTGEKMFLDIGEQEIISIRWCSDITGGALYVVRLDGPGLNCHESYMLIQASKNRVISSESFGNCADSVSFSSSVPGKIEMKVFGQNIDKWVWKH